ncbi:MAG: hypothetical protein JST00_05555 [Deltaproteobacteria bacterium]|nr:hypothetical protein [Deltaproteobacteria bacterium]
MRLKVMPRPWTAPRTRTLIALLAFVLGLGTIPHRLCERDAQAYFEGDAASVDRLATSVARWTEDRSLAAAAFSTGSKRFDAEWLFGTYMMAAMGFGQVALETRDPSRKRESITRMERCLDAVLGPSGRAFDHEAWGIDALASTRVAPGSPHDRGHVAYLGYAGLALGLHRVLVPSSRFAEIDDAIVAALARRIEGSPTGLLETYPGEVYPVDNAAALGAIALRARALGKEPPRGLGLGLAAIRSRVDRTTGLLVQAVDAGDGSPRDRARGSGTALAAYFLGFADPATSGELYRALHRELFRTVIGFGAVLEYAPTSDTKGARGHGDIDSGPIALGFGVSATGFALGASRMNDDRDVFASLYATAHLFGAPFDTAAQRTFATGGPLGDAILFAMITAPRRTAEGSAS